MTLARLPQRDKDLPIHRQRQSRLIQTAPSNLLSQSLSPSPTLRFPSNANPSLFPLADPSLPTPRVAAAFLFFPVFAAFALIATWDKTLPFHA
jgi:hypothetical protein